MRTHFTVIALLLAIQLATARQASAQARSAASPREDVTTVGRAAVTALNAGQYEAALAGFSAVLKLDPTSGDAYFLRGMCRLDLAEGQNAQAGGVYQDLDRKYLPPAVADFTRAIALDPKHAVHIFGAA